MCWICRHAPADPSSPRTCTRFPEGIPPDRLAQTFYDQGRSGAGVPSCFEPASEAARAYVSYILGLRGPLSS